MCVCVVVMLVMFVWYYWFLLMGLVIECLKSFGVVFEDFGYMVVMFFYKRVFWGMMVFVCFYCLGEGLILMEG